jgi:serine/threonine protein kinase
MEDRLERRLGNYQLTRLLARGGFAEVYLGQHIYLKNQAAIKVLQTRLSGNDMESFLNEARTVVNLIHPNIVRVLEFGVEGDTPFLVMDYAPNGSLRQCYPKGVQLPLSSVKAYVKQAASALQYAHDQKLIHRDIKPENMLLGGNNELLISDFGIAVFAHSSLSESTQQVVGTVAYMAPEQVQGKPRPASDQYALAIVAYEWLCGERPFHGNLTEIATQQMFTDPLPLREKVPDIPPAVERAIMTALAKDPRQRYSTILDFANALECASQSIPRPTQPTLDQKSPMLSKTLVVGSNDSSKAVTHSSRTRKEQVTVDSPAWKTGRKLFAVEGIKKHQVFYVVLGVLLYTLSSNFVMLIHLPPVHGNELLWILPTLVIPVAFGIIYGFWAGLVTGGLGYFLGSYISIVIRSNSVSSSSIGFLTLSALPLPWYFHLGFLSTGSIAGLATIITKGRYQSIQNIAVAESFSVIGILSGFFIVFNNFWPHLYHNESLLIDFTHIALPNMMLVLILLPLILTIQSLFNKDKRPSAPHS